MTSGFTIVTDLPTRCRGSLTASDVMDHMPGGARHAPGTVTPTP